MAKGSGWQVFRVGRSFGLQLSRVGGGDPVEVWLPRAPSDVTRTALLGSLVAGAYGAVDQATATEAMGADW